MKMEERDRLIREDGFAEGRDFGISEGLSQGISQGIYEGLSQGEERISQLNLCLIREKRYDDLERASQDKDFRELLLKEFSL